MLIPTYRIRVMVNPLYSLPYVHGFTPFLFPLWIHSCIPPQTDQNTQKVEGYQALSGANKISEEEEDPPVVQNRLPMFDTGNHHAEVVMRAIVENHQSSSGS